MTSLHWQLSADYRNALSPNFYADGTPAGFPDPQILVFNQPLAQQLGLLNANENADLTQLADLLVGNRFPDHSQPIAQAYAGHQFGRFNMLGDGRATLLGEQLTPQGEKIDIQLKGNGVTPYSRRGDGKAALAPMLREYLISEAMNALNIPTTRSLAVTTTGENIYRETALDGAVLTRTAASHLRVATFQFAAAFTHQQELKSLADYVIARHFPEISSEDENPYLQLLAKVINRQAQLIAKWQLVGFIHGVMNTDNMAISGETIDYGPCAFMDHYDPQTVFSAIDHGGRYRYENQPLIAEWNLTRFAEALLPLFSDEQSEAIELATQKLAEFEPLYQRYYAEGMAKKLGLFAIEEGDQALSEELLHLMRINQADYTNTFIGLTLEVMGGKRKLDGTQAVFSSQFFANWWEQWQARLAKQSQSKAEIIALMQAANPFVIPRNHWVEEVLARAIEGDLQPFQQLLIALQQPFDYNADVAHYQQVLEPNDNYQTFCGT
ncbi:hypothetical protein A1D29_06050 [Pasteurellaceae bacterium Orientalotternb1]|nr:hypothetical protein A1D29_06050 [Pasteurellaceae bacterium Orientalotternb1]